jgi:hypothetical protein
MYFPTVRPTFVFANNSTWHNPVSLSKLQPMTISQLDLAATVAMSVDVIGMNAIADAD